MASQTSKSSENTKQKNRNYSKICIITNCEHNKYNARNSDVKMFRVPTDERYHIWCEAIRPFALAPYQGLVCIEHFNKSHLIGRQRITLKKDAIPTMFPAIPAIANIANEPVINNSDSSDSTDSTDMVQLMQSMHFAQGADREDNNDNKSENITESNMKDVKCCNSAEMFEIAQAEYSNLRQDYIELEAKKCIEIAKLQNELRNYKTETDIQKQEIKYLTKKVVKLEKSERSLKTLVESLEELVAQNILSEEAYEVLEKIDKSEILKCIVYGQTALTKYPPEVRKFCFVLNYYSPAAYRIIRAQFNNHLPHPRTLAEWFKASDITGEHGFNEGTMKRLAGFAKELKDSTGEELICTLMFDEMYIKKQVYWDQCKFQYVGYPTFENNKPNIPKKGAALGQRDNEPNEPSIEAIEAGESGTGYKSKVTRVTRATCAANADNNVHNVDSLHVQEADIFEPEDDGIRENGAKSGKVKSPLASRAIVFMLSGLNKSFEFPVGYHLVNGLGGEGSSNLVNEVITKVSEQGVKISNLTFDGAKDNLNMCEIFGANLDPLSDDFRPFIISPYDGSKIFIILDPSHMEKLMRNLIGNHEILFDQFDNKIEWHYFVALQEVSKNGNLLTHKLSKKHTTEFKRNKMNVRLAAETFSTSVADSFKILREKNHENFVDSFPTEMFTRMIDKIFDILNSRDTRHSNPFKRPLSFENKREIFEFINESITSLKGLKMNQIRKRNGTERTVKVNVLKTLNKTPVLGFLVNLTNIPLMYAQYVEKVDVFDSNENPPSQRMTHFRTYPLSQDRIELFFAKIRSRNGHNNNPNCAQFKGAYRRLLANIEIIPPASANCMMFDEIDLHMFTPQSNIYSVTSRRPKVDILSDETFNNNLTKFEKQQEDLEALSDLAGMKNNGHLLEGFASTSIAYAAKLIEQSILDGEFHCDCCKSVFIENKKMNCGSVCLIPSKTPCESTYYICHLVDKYFDAFKPNRLGNVKNVDFRVLFYQVFKEIDYDKIFANTNFRNHEQHRFYLVKIIVQNYIFMKTSQISKSITFDEYDKIIRSKLTKWIHFMGQ